VPLITLTTDFGTLDGYAGAMKGRILEICPDARIIDLSHEIEPQDVLGAAWCLSRACSQFPAGTIHVAVIDPGVGSEREPLLLKAGGQWLIGPDNGLFTELLRKCELEESYALHRHSPWWKAHQSFDGIALFAPAAACLAKGIPPEQLGKPIESLNVLRLKAPYSQGQHMMGQVILFDRFGNAITNLNRSDLPSIDSSTEFHCNDQVFPFVDHYKQGRDLEALAIINSDELIELAIYCGSARERFQLNKGDPVSVELP